MTLEELKREAKAAGYNLIPISRPEKLLPCICGRQRRQTLYDSTNRTLFLRCPKCGRTATGKTENEVRANWNKYIKEAETE